MQTQWQQLRVLHAQLVLQEASAEGPQLPTLVAHLTLHSQLEMESQGRGQEAKVRARQKAGTPDAAAEACGRLAQGRLFRPRGLMSQGVCGPGALASVLSLKCGGAAAFTL